MLEVFVSYYALHIATIIESLCKYQEIMILLKAMCMYTAEIRL